tara:strand:+ start:554 stop:859 length:306 start_codon:yes stop_codon:yes gene_type:complete
MNEWEAIIKARTSPIRELDPSRNPRKPQRRKPPVKIAGGKPSPSMGESGDLDTMFDEDMANLAEMTRKDLFPMVIKRISKMSKEELLAILERTQGSLEEKI